MTSTVLILCENHNSITIKKITEFIEDGCYFDEKTKFLFPDNEQCVHIKYAQNHRPIIFEIIDNTKIVEEIKEERIESIIEITEAKSSLNKEKINLILSAISRVNHVFCFKFYYIDMDEDCWEMMACVESLLAREDNGIIFADEGIYNSNLELFLDYMNYQ
jgi:hypothetical protein